MPGKQEKVFTIGILHIPKGCQPLLELSIDMSIFTDNFDGTMLSRHPNKNGILYIHIS